MTDDTFYRATRLSKQIVDLDIFIRNLEFNPHASGVPTQVLSHPEDQLRPYNAFVERLPIYPREKRVNQSDEYIALCNEFGPLILARLKEIRAKWQVEFDSL